jgi:hypothetical protein
VFEILSPIRYTFGRAVSKAFSWRLRTAEARFLSHGSPLGFVVHMQSHWDRFYSDIFSVIIPSTAQSIFFFVWSGGRGMDSGPLRGCNSKTYSLTPFGKGNKFRFQTLVGLWLSSVDLASVTQYVCLRCLLNAHTLFLIHVMSRILSVTWYFWKSGRLHAEFA